MAQITELNRKRGQAKGFITRAETFVSSITKNTQLDILMVRLDLLEKAFINFADADSELALLEEDSEMSEVENRFVIVKAKLNEQIRSKLPRDTVTNKEFNDTFTKFAEQQRELMEGIHDRSFIQKEDVRLPAISIPKFSGKISDFPSFKNLFEVTIHNTSMPKIHKFKYLKGYLTDDAASLLKHVLVTEENYEGAWTKLVNRYDNKQQIVINLIKQFINQPTSNSASKLRELADVSDEVLRGLEALGNEAEQRDCWLIYLLLEKCDVETKRAWALANDKDYPTINQFLDFITKRVNSLETVEVSDHKKQSQRRAVVLSSVIDKEQCPCCSKEHSLYNCEQFLKLNSAERRSFITEKQLCYSCMKKGHQAARCRIRSSCKKCGRRHNSLLCVSEREQLNTKDVDTKIETTSSSITAQLNASMNQSILPTAVVRIQDSGGRSVWCRALLDSGSQVTIIDEELANKLQLTRTNCRVRISGVSTSNIYSRGMANIQIRSRFSTNESISIDVLIIPKLPVQLPEINLPMQQLKKIKNLELADPNFSRTSKLNLLIGADAFISSIRDGRRDLGHNVFALKTIFSDIISGSANITHHTSSFNVSIDVDETLRKFWELEEVDRSIESSEEKELAEVWFKETTTRNPDGRFIVRLPFKPNCGTLGNSFGIAKKRFMSLERRLRHDSELKNEYVRFMTEYKELNHMTRLSTGERVTESYYLPHHAVVKLSSTTTKVRVVFDGSSKTHSGLSLNDILMCGPAVQSSLWDILLRFRKFRYVMAADIEKMYRQIQIAEPDRQYQQILWREHPDQEFRQYCLNTVTYGTTSAPFLATRCLKELGLENLEEYPEAGKAIISDFYVDDFLSGTETIDQLEALKCQVSKILSSAGFELRKWAYNCEMASDQNADNFKEFDRDSPLKLLGVRWIPSIDAFTFEVEIFEDGDITKRRFLSEASKVFDPLGWLAPSLIIAKIIFQELWIKNLDWDDVLPPEIQNKWRNLHVEFQEFRHLKIPRWMGSGEMEIHGFCDASKLAYGAVVYTRRIEQDGTISTNIVTAKTKVAIIKTVTIPRLELCGALLLAKLLKAVSLSTNIPLKAMKAWTDSSVVLAYLSANATRWKPFIANRVREIITMCPRNIWGYVKSRDNPADVCSRGEYPAKLIKNELWWHGPLWLKSQNADRNHNTDETDINTDDTHINDELRVSVNLVVNNDQKSVLQTLIDAKSSFSELIRLLATIFRFISRCRAGKSRKNDIPYLTTTELKEAEIIIIKHVQGVNFADEIKATQTNQEISHTSSIKRLSPFLDEDGILRVGGRLKHAALEYDTKHQILLPKSSNVSKFLMRYFHIKYLHTGTALTFNMSRQRYWIVHGRSIANQVTRQCVICRRYKPVSPYQIMGQLPKSRLTGFRAFVNTGIDYAGPISIASKRGRGARISKGYIAVFVCTTTKAIHIEMVTDLTTNAFIACLKRFVSRRGVPANIYSDNANNFVGAHEKLKRLASIHDGGIREILQITSSAEFNTEVGNYAATNSITWHFIPPLAPHFGGLWESGVKSVKTHLKKAVGAINLTFEEMSTLLCLIEAVLNSRPLVPQFDSDTSYEAITPGHFLIGTPVTSIPEPFTLESMKVHNIWDEIQLRVVHFWKKFHREYLHTLQQRQKWINPAENLKIGDMVILKDDNYPPCNWPLGRIIQVHPGTDGHVRVVTVKTSTSVFKRPLSKIVKLMDD